MTLNELIVHLDVLYQQHGDIPVYFSEEGRYPELLDEDNINMKYAYIGEDKWTTYPKRIEIGQS